MAAINIAGVDVQAAATKPRRMSMLLWGTSGAGKTTLACTAPGKKLLILFDPDGDASVAEQDNLDVVDLSGASASRVVALFKSDTKPLGLTAESIDEYDTIIVDSLTNAQHLAVQYGISTVKGATVERPSMGAYQTRNALVTQLVKNMLNFTSKNNKHMIFTAHEASPQLNDDGVVLSITLALGGQLPTQAPVDFSEVWFVDDTGKQRRIAVRPCRARRPMKTRMWRTDQGPEFQWEHNGQEIAQWYEQWQSNGWTKLPLPK